jgi:hypothetical protein
MSKSKAFLVLASTSDCPKEWVVFAFNRNSAAEKMSVEEFNHCTLSFDCCSGAIEGFDLLAVNIAKFNSMKELISEMNAFRHVSYPIYDYGKNWFFVKPSGYFSVWALPIEWMGYTRFSCTDEDAVFMNKIKPSAIFASKGHGVVVWTITRSNFFKKMFGIVAKDIDGRILDDALSESSHTKSLGVLYLAKKGEFRDFDMYQYPLKLVLSSTDYFTPDSTFDWEFTKICEVSYDSKVDARYSDEGDTAN